MFLHKKPLFTAVFFISFKRILISKRIINTETNDFFAFFGDTFSKEDVSGFLMRVADIGKRSGDSGYISRRLRRRGLRSWDSFLHRAYNDCIPIGG